MTATITALPAGGNGNYYLSDYHLGPGKELGTWWGDAASRLGLTREIEKNQFQSILKGLNPHTAKSMVKQHQERVPAIDLTFSVDKTISATWAVSDTATQKKIERCGAEAIEEVLQWMQDKLPLVRKGQGGAIEEHGKFLAAIFRHETNRNGDPNLHWHCVIPNLVFDANGKCSHIHTKKIFEFTRTLGPMFRATLARKLRQDLKIELVQAESQNGKLAGWFKLPGVPEELAKLWSSRSAEIAEFLMPKGLSRDSASPQFRALANTQTRKSKDRLPPLEILKERWGREAKSYGFSHTSTQQEQMTFSKRQISQQFSQAFRETILEFEKERTHFEYKDLLRNVAERMQVCGISVTALTDKLDKKIASTKSLIHLSEQGVDQIFTTRSIWRCEEKLLKDIDRLDQRRGAFVSKDVVESVLKNRATISDEQAKAVRQLTRGKSSLRLLRGVAGAGKTYTLDAVRDAFQKGGFEVVGTSTSGLATETLASEAKIKSRTIASLLYQITGKSFQGDVRKAENPFHRKSVLIVDEASMVDLRSMQTVIQAARKAKGTVILVGDDKQLQAVGAGGPFSYLIGRRKASVLDDNRRQKDAADRKAVSDLRHGNVAEALQSYLKRGHLKVAETRQQAAKDLVKKWARSGGSMFPGNHSIFTQTRQEASYLNELCQAKRMADGTVDSQSYISLGATRFHMGDRVLFNKSDRTQGIQNGHRGTVLHVDPQTGAMKVRLDAQKDGLCKTVLVSVKRREEGEVTLGYAATTHKMQGQTTPHSYVLLGGGMTDNNMAYTQMTRGKESTTMFIDAFSAGDDLGTLARAMKRTNTKSLAHDFQKPASHDTSLER